MRTIEGSTDNETLVKITRQQKKGGKTGTGSKDAENTSEPGKTKPEHGINRQEGRNPDLRVRTF